MKTRTRYTVATAVLVATATPLIAQWAPSTDALTTVQTDPDGLAIHGYDPVAYFTQERAVEGAEQHQLRWQGATYRFATAENLTTFRQDPQRYAPQYGGYCAWGVAAKGSLFNIDPTAWRVVDGKLYLNYNADVQQTWLADTEGFIRSADRQWPTLKPTPKR